MLDYLADGASADSVLLQYGAVGVLALVSIGAVITLWKRQEKNYDKTYEAERQRGDRLESELLALNKLISSELSGHLVRATEAMKEVTDLVRRRER